MDARQQLGQRLKHLRRLRGYTQERLAERIDIIVTGHAHQGTPQPLDVRLQGPGGGRWLRR